MKIKSILFFAATVCFASSPAWGDSLKFQPTPSENFNIVRSEDAPRFGHFGANFFPGFQAGQPKNSLLILKEGHSIFVFFNSDGPHGPKRDAPRRDPIGTPEPASITLLFAGLLGVAALIRRRPSALAVS